MTDEQDLDRALTELGDLLGAEAVEEVGPEGLVLALAGGDRLEEELGAGTMVGFMLFTHH